MQPDRNEKQYPTVIQECAANFDKVYVSGGRIGTTLCMAPEDLKKVSRAEYADLFSKNRKNCMEADQNEEKSSGLFLFTVMRLGNFFQKRIIK